MSNEPKAGGSLDPEMLAAYIDKRLSPDARAVVEAKLATDPDSYELLVELIHANEALKGEQPQEETTNEPVDRPEPQAKTGAVVPLVPKPKRTRGWAIAGGVLAMAAALVLVVRLQPDLLQRLRGGDAVDPQLAKLVAAVGEERYIEARLTGGFKYGPLKSVTRGSGDLSQQNLALLAAAGELQNRVRNSTAAADLHRWGIAQLLLGDTDGALSALNAAVAVEPSSTEYLSDLAAAYLARHAQRNTAEDLPAALENAEKVLDLDAAHREALFNKALALGKLGAADAAVEAWREYVKVDPDSPWAAAAASHLRPLSQIRPTELNVGEILRAASVEGPSVGTDLQSVREFAEDVLAPSALDSLGSGQVDSPRMAQAIELADYLARKQGDTLLLDALKGAVVTPTSLKTLALREAFECHRQMRAFYRQGDSVRQQQIGRACIDAFTRADVEFVRWERVYLARAIGGQNPAESEAIARAVADAPDAARFPVVQAWAWHQIGGLRYLAGDYATAVRFLSQSAAQFEATREAEHAGSAHETLAASYLAMGNHRNAWKHYVRALESSPTRAFSMTSYATRNGVGIAALRSGMPRAARVVFNDNLRIAESVGSLGRVAETQRNLAEACLSTGDLQCVSRHLQAGLEAVSALAKVAPNRRTEAEYAWIRARLAAETGSPDSIDAVAAATRKFSDLRVYPRLVSLRLLEAGIARHAGQLDDALHAVTEGLRLVESQEAVLQNAETRETFRHSVASFYREGARAWIEKGDPVRALAQLERQHFRGTPLTVGDHSLPADTAGVVFLVEPDAVYRWTLSSSGLTFGKVDVNYEELRRETAAIRASASRGHARESATSSHLAQLLFGDVLFHAAGITRIIIVPDGPLRGLPFASLRMPDGLVLVERFELAIAESLSAYSGDEGPRSGANAHVAVFAAPVNEEYGLPILPATIGEGRAIAALYGVPLRSGSDATPEHFLKSLMTDDVVHFSGHAIVDPHAQWRDHLVLTPSPGSPSGLLHQSKLLTQHLRARVVVLAGCSTASGFSELSPNPTSLAGTLVAAGVRWVIGTLWPIDDAESQLIFTDIHRALANGADPVSAVREVQRAAASDPAKLSLWAALVVVVG